MKVAILCGGRGERLREETEFKPKPLIEIGSMPIIWHIMKIYSQFGFKDFVLLLGYKGSMIKEFFLNFEYMANDFTLNLRDRANPVTYHKDAGLEDWTITFLDTGLDTNTGGRIARAKHFLQDDDFFLTYGDGLCTVNLHDLHAYHKRMNKTLTLTGVSPSSMFGVIETEAGIVKSFKEKPKLDGMINGGFFVCRKDIFECLTPDTGCVFEEEPMRTLAQRSQIAVFEHKAFWASMDTYKQVQYLNGLWNRPNPPWKSWT